MKSIPRIILAGMISLCFLLVLIVAGCSKDAIQPYTYEPPEQLNDGMEVGTLAQVNIDSGLLIKAVDRINRGKYGEVHSLLMFKDDKLVFEEYFPGHTYQWDGPNHHGEWVSWDRSMPHIIMSATKSITSTCIGIAIDQGLIASVDQSIFDYLPEHQHLRTDGKNDITIEHLLTMTSGLAWDEWGTLLSSEENDLVALSFDCEDPIECILERPLVTHPGTSFTYSGGNMIVLGEIIRYATGMPIDSFSQKYLFEPLGIDSVSWAERYENGVIYAGGGIYLTPREMVKYGVLQLDQGVFHGQQLISEEWIDNCHTPYANNANIDIPGHESGNHSYSYSWWLRSFEQSGRTINLYHAVGWGGQEIMILPELETVVVVTGGNYVTEVEVIELFETHLLPAIR